MMKKDKKIINNVSWKEGYIVDEASNGHEWFRKIEIYGLFLCTSGCSITYVKWKSILSELRKTKATPVIIMSAQADEQSRVEGFELGADDYVVKPF